ncbi:MAG: T9SS type A sorting domain-containing protein [Bacteroidales bacterium]|nr:T9SS type A sorting domain-containing protein [Bacteroidales bacterium]
MKKCVLFTKVIMVLVVSLSFMFSQVFAQGSDLTKIVDPNGPNFEVKGELDCPDESMLDQSAVGFTSAGNSDEDGGYLFYQPFSGLDADIETMTWWSIHAFHDGTSWGPCSEDPMNFEVVFYEEDGGIGSIVSTFNETITAIPTGEMFAGTYEIMRYEYTLPSAIALEDGWVSILASGDPSCWFLWLNSGTLNLPGVQEDLAAGTFTTQDYSMSLCLGGDSGPPTFDPPTDLTSDIVDGNVELNWVAPGGGGGDLVELVQHDGNYENAYYQAYDNGYGVVYGISAYPGATLEFVDYRHSPWGIFGIWDYKLHVVDWDTYTEVYVTDVLQSTGDDQWEEEIPLGSLAGQSGLVGVFLEPMSNDPADAYPCMDGDNVGPDGMSYNGPLSDYSAMTLSTVGDFLMDLWIMTAGDKIVVKPPKVQINNNTSGITRNPGTPLTGKEYIMKQKAIVSASDLDLDSYNVYHRLGETGDFTVLENVPVPTTTYTHENPVPGHHYYYVTAVYADPVGESVGTETVDEVITGINNIMMNNNINVYPNPATDVVNISSDYIITSVEVYNYTGQLISDNQVNTKSYQINTSEFNTGIYFFQVETTKGKISKRIIIE